MQKLTSNKTPTLIFSTRSGALYNLTPSNSPTLNALQLSVGDFFKTKNVIDQLPQGLTFKKFLGYNQSIITYLTPYDYYKDKCMSGCHGNKVKIMGNKGYEEVKAFDYWELAEKIKPDILVGLTQMPSLQKNHKEESNKGYKRAINKTTQFLKQFSKPQKKGIFLAPLHGGKNLGLLTKSLQECLQFDYVDGFVICDLCQEESIEQREGVYELINKRLKLQNKQFILSLSGEGTIQDIQHGFKHGIKLFEVNYPFRLAQQQKALVKENDKFVAKSPQLKQNLEPLSKQCSCNTCKNYSESYIAHLIKCYQMTAKVLLTVHNLHQYVQHFKQLQ